MQSMRARRDVHNEKERCTARGVRFGYYIQTIEDPAASTLYSRFFVRSYEAHFNGMLYIGGVMTTMQGREGREGGNSSDPGSCA